MYLLKTTVVMWNRQGYKKNAWSIFPFYCVNIVASNLLVIGKFEGFYVVEMKKKSSDIILFIVQAISLDAHIRRLDNTRAKSGALS